MAQYTSVPEALAGILAQDLSMSEALALFSRELERLNPVLARANEALIERLRKAGVGGAAPEIGDRLPDFALPDESGRLRTLGDFTKRGPVVVSLVRGHWCPFCQIESTALARATAQFDVHGASVVLIVPEKQSYARLISDRAGPLPVLCDLEGAYALELGLAFYMGDALVDIFKSAGSRIPVFQGSEGWRLPIPATFVIDRNAVVVERLVDPDFRLRRLTIEKILAALPRAASRMQGA